MKSNILTNEAQANSTQKRFSDKDVILQKTPNWPDKPFMVVPLDQRKTQFFRSLEVASAVAHDLAKQSNGEVLSKFAIES